MLQKDDKDAQIEFLKERILKIRGMLDEVFVEEEIPMCGGYSDEYELYYEVGGVSNIKNLCDKTLMEVTF